MSVPAESESRPSTSLLTTTPPPLVLPQDIRTAMEQCAARLDGRGAVAVCGFPASGKSTAAAYLASLVGATVLDKDTLAPGLEQAVMGELTGDPHDRDSETYRRLIAPHIYDALLRIALTVAVKHPVVLDAPFLEVIRQAARAGVPLSVQMLARSGINSAPPLSTVWLDSSAEQIRSRMIARGAERDNPKLADWPAYQADVLNSGVRELAHSVVDVVIGN
ncbi:ATP-binding protein [Nocardia vinacea]|uniref:AAA family ATPase n=1 Tax=Nocardia vinacea TaxID=96468 RepID=UPI002E0E7F9E|nr:ATP-binding protein [Nocardia vinacea]